MQVLSDKRVGRYVSLKSRLVSQLLIGSLMTITVSLSLQASPKNEFGVKISNFGKVNDNYYRGAQPDEHGFEQLKALGIKTVIDLQDDGLTQEEGWVRSAGMQYIRLALSSTRAATDEQVASFLKLVNDPNNLPVYVHCTGGRHRTGEMTAIYRITHDQWTADRSFQEMKQYNWYSTGGHGCTKDYVYDFYSRHQNGASMTAAAAATDATPAGQAKTQEATTVQVVQNDQKTGVKKDQ